jgi:hypothetical protein
MILVLSYDFYEQGTDPVIDWLLYYNANFIKVTIQDLINKDADFKIDVNKGKIIFKEKDITDNISTVWYRRFVDDIHLDFSINDKHHEQAKFELQNEMIELVKFLALILKDKKWMPSFEGIKINKLETLYFANLLNINVPKTIVTNNKKDLQKFIGLNEPNNYIFKPINHSGYFVDDTKTYNIYTNSLEPIFYNKLPDYFVCTLFQEKVNKKFEIRSFYLDGNFYSSAIITQTIHCDVKLSFNSEDINWIPYQLPISYQNKLDLFFKSINLNTCSFDVIKTNNNEYVLLEINPVGQYSAPGTRCNYYLEEKIAQWLIKNEN